MANYLFIAVGVDQESRVERFLFRDYNLDPQDLIRWKADGVVFFFIAKAASLGPYQAHNIYLGYCIDYEQGEVIYNLNPDRSLPKEGLDGCYINIQRTPNGKIVISNDFFSQLPITFFATNKCTAYSDSVFVLSKLRDALGLSVELDYKSIKSRAWINSITNQLITEDTAVLAIKYLPPQNYIEIEVKEGLIFVRKRDAIPPVSYKEKEYIQAVREAASNIRSLLTSLIKKTRISLSLSGGMDSRVILAGLICERNSENLILGSNQKIERDFEVANSIAKSLSLELNSRKNYLSIKAKHVDRLSTYVLFSCGVYDSIYCPSRIPIGQPPISVTGHGAELYKGNYGLRSIIEITKSCPINKHELESQLVSGVLKIHLDPARCTSGESHYYGYRNALHGARATMFSLYSLRPIMQKSLSLFFMRGGEGAITESYRDSVIQDILILLSPKLAEHEFDKPKKNITRSHISSRLSELGGCIEEYELRQFTIIGSPSDNQGSFPEFFYQLAASDCYTGDLDFDSLMERFSNKESIYKTKLSEEIGYWEKALQGYKNLGFSENESKNIAAGKIITAAVFGRNSN